MFELCASILAADFAHLARDVQAADLAGVDAFHIDIMDGHFVSAISFGTDMVRTMRALTHKPLDVHLMVEYPINFVEKLASLGVERVSVHAEIAGGPGETLDTIHAAGMRAGLVINPETPVEAVKAHLERIDYLLLMMVKPGRGGQASLPGSNEKITAARLLLRENGACVTIQVDGGVTPSIILSARVAGAQSFVAGSAVFNGTIGDNVTSLKKAMEKASL